jgi:hypothetical protein
LDDIARKRGDEAAKLSGIQTRQQQWRMAIGGAAPAAGIEEGRTLTLAGVKGSVAATSTSTAAGTKASTCGAAGLSSDCLPVPACAAHKLGLCLSMPWQSAIAIKAGFKVSGDSIGHA